MTIIHTWHIVELRRSIANGFVTQIHYDVVAEEDNVKANRIGTIDFEHKDDFVPFENLTQNDIFQWMFDALNKQQLENELDQELKAKQETAYLVGFPWN